VAGLPQVVRERLEARGLTLCVVEEQDLRHLRLLCYDPAWSNDPIS
jgi:hypothetical protein